MAEAGKQKDPVYEDWFGLEAVLLVVAARKFRGLGLRGLDSVIPGSSTTARDLAHETTAKLLKKGLWKPGQNGSEIYPLAIVTLNNLFRDVLKSSSYKTTVIVEPDEIDATIQSINTTQPEESIFRDEQYAWLERRFDKDEDGRAYVRALRKGLILPEDISADIGKSVNEVKTIRRRVLYKLHLMEQLRD